MTTLRKIELGHVQGLANNIYKEQPNTKIFSLFNFTGGGSNSFLNVGKLEMIYDVDMPLEVSLSK